MQDLLAQHWEFGKCSKSDDFTKLSRKLRVVLNDSIHPTYVIVIKIWISRMETESKVTLS